MAPFHWPTNAPHIGDTMTLSVALRQKFLSFFTALPACALTFTIALIGAAAGYWLHLPMGILLGAMGFVAIFAISGRAIFGVRVMFPAKLRMGFVPIIGLGIGGSFTPTVMGQIPSWWLSLLALALFIPMAHFIGYLIYRAGGLDRPTALFGSVPGGLIESVTLGEQVGGDVQMLALLQFLRLIFTIVLVPVSFMILTGHMVGSAAVVGVIRAPLGLLDGTILLAAGAAGLMIGRLLHLPAAIMTGPLLGSGLVHLLGYVEGVPPAWAVGSDADRHWSYFGRTFCRPSKGRHFARQPLSAGQCSGGHGVGDWFWIFSAYRVRPVGFGRVFSLCTGRFGGNEFDRP